MWVSAFFGMMTAFAENVLGRIYRQRVAGRLTGGPMYYIERGLGLKWLARLYCVFCIFTCLGMGGMVQSNAISESLRESAGLHPAVTGILLSGTVAAVASGGAVQTMRFAARVTPLMCGLYISGCAALIAINADKIIPSLKLVINGAFSLEAAGPGLMGYSIARAIRYGVSEVFFQMRRAWERRYGKLRG
jgi:AGCS family alanine or glycine:cation symporter